jgi:hypothetical protein
LAAYVVLHAGRPVLLLPSRRHARRRVGRRVLLSWDGGKEAARALQLALPLLQAAEAGAGGGVRHRRRQPARWPTRWRPIRCPGWRATACTATLRCTVERQARRRSRAMKWAKPCWRWPAMAADLLVMGAYGHSRLRETILGGVTRTVFEEHDAAGADGALRLI